MSKSLAVVAARIVELVATCSGIRVTATSPILSSGVLNAADMVVLVGLLEWEYGVQFDLSDLDVRDIDVPSLLARIIVAKLDGMDTDALTERATATTHSLAAS